MDEKIRTPAPASPTSAGRSELRSSETRDLVPAPQPTSKLKSPRRSWLRVALAVVIVVGGGWAAFYWWQHSRSPFPPGIASGNGRIEADEIDIDTKFAGRISEMVADEGDMVFLHAVSI